MRIRYGVAGIAAVLGLALAAPNLPTTLTVQSRAGQVLVHCYVNL